MEQDLSARRRKHGWQRLLYRGGDVGGLVKEIATTS